MRPATVFAGLVGLLSIALLASGYMVTALLAAVFSMLIFASRAVSPDRERHDSGGYVPDVSSSSSSTWGDCRDGSNHCDAGSDGGSDGGGDGGGGD